MNASLFNMFHDAANQHIFTVNFDFCACIFTKQHLVTRFYVQWAHIAIAIYFAITYS